jgi:tetratricopeptide (TPR) repeat protein
MSAAGRDRDRQVIPRWRDLASTAQHGELAQASGGPVVRRLDVAHAPDGGWLQARLGDFREHPSPSFAADLISASIVLGATPETTKAAEVVLDSSASPMMVRETATVILKRDADVITGPAEPIRRQEIARLRHGLRANPRNALRWAELSRHYVNEGLKVKATNAMRIAVNMAPYDRYVLRCAVRLWTHQGEPDRALRTLRNAKATVLSDPWLLASEIATASSAEKVSRHVRRGREMVELSAHTPLALSELRSALATIELRAGGERRARRLFRSALVDPNENSVAQIEWASSRMSGIALDEEQLQLSPEARARRTAEQQDIDGTLAGAWDWLLDQPFSTEPAVFGSYHASMFGRFEEGIALAEQALRANPRDALLLNNLAFCLAAMDRWREAQKRLEEIPDDHAAWLKGTITATQGFIRLRAGDLEAGRALYREAIGAMKGRSKTMRAELMLTAEEIRIGEVSAIARAAQLIDAIERSDAAQLKGWLRFLPQSRANNRGPEDRQRR